MRITFDKQIVQRLIEHSEGSASHKTLYGVKTTNAPGLWIVGDEGVYLMSNGDPGLKDEKSVTGGHVVCYADQCNPKKMAFEDWYEAKERIFGGDDGVEFVSARDIRAALLVPGNKIKINLSKTRLSIVTVGAAPAR